MFIEKSAEILPRMLCISIIYARFKKITQATLAQSLHTTSSSLQSSGFSQGLRYALALTHAVLLLRVLCYSHVIPIFRL